MAKTLEFMANFESYFGPREVDNQRIGRGDVATFDDKKADLILALRMPPKSGGGPVAKLVPEQELRKMFDLEEERVSNDRQSIEDDPGHLVKYKLKPSEFARHHPALAQKFAAEAKRSAAAAPK